MPDSYSREACKARHDALEQWVKRIDSKVNGLIVFIGSCLVGMLAFVGREIFLRAFGE